MNASSDAVDVAQDYKDFVRMVSHDFCAPIRHIRGFAKLLVAAQPNELDDDMRQYADQLEAALERFEAMHSAMRTYSRVTTDAGDMREVNSADVIESALAELDDKIDQSSAVICVGDLPRFDVNFEQLRYVFVELIENALKFRKDGAPARITIRAMQSDDGVRFQIEDNGIGLHESYLERAFSMFTQFNQYNEYPGVGAGLAISKKIVERHGGEMWIESVLEEWTRVSFSLPRAAQPACAA